MSALPVNVTTRFRIEQNHLQLHIVKSKGKISTIIREKTQTTIHVRHDFDDLLLKDRAWIYKVVVNELFKRGEEFLIQRLQHFANEKQIHISKISIKNLSRVWGRCSIHAHITLNIWLMALPPHLIDYVIIHELNHTKHFNHSPAFWSELDKWLNTSSKALKKELNNFTKILLA